MSIIDELYDTDLSINKRIIKQPKIAVSVPEKSKLTDTVFVYNNGLAWRIVTHAIQQVYPVIHDIYFELDKTYPITVIMCPFTFLSIVYFGTFNPIDKVYNNSITLINQENKDILLIPLQNKFYSLSTGKLIESVGNTVRRDEVKIMTLRNAISKYPDVHFIETNNDRNNNNNNNFKSLKLNHSFKPYDEKYNAYTLLYVIEYVSKKTGKNKYSAIIPKNSSKKEGTSYDIHQNGIETYLASMIEKIRERGGIMFPCFWAAWISYISNTKLIKL